MHIPMGWSGIAIHKDLNKNDKIYHFYKIKRFRELIQTKKMHLTSLYSVWSDPWELPYRYININAKFDYEEFLLSYANRFIEKKAKGLCFTSIYDVDAMWKQYSGNEECICVETTVENLVESIKCNHFSNLFIAPVQYIDLINNLKELLISDKKSDYPYITWMAFIKRINYKYENEVRMVIEPTFNDELEDLKIDINKYINKVILPPRKCDMHCNDWESHKEQRILNFKNKFNITYECTISDLYHCIDININEFDDDHKKVFEVQNNYPPGHFLYNVDNNGNFIKCY